MEWRSFGRTGLKVTEICLGTMTLAGQADEATSFAILDTAFEGGIRFLDTADCYPINPHVHTAGDTELLLGRWLASRKCRHEVVLSTKSYFSVGRSPLHRGNSRRHVLDACEASLRRLGTDRVDIYHCHGWDATVPVEETLRALDDLRRAGKILYVAFSNVKTHEVARALVTAAACGVPPIDGLQPRHNLLHRNAEESLLPLAREFGLGVMVYNPIAGGLLSGKYVPDAEPQPDSRFTMETIGKIYRDRYWTTRNLEVAQELKRRADEIGLSPVTAAVAWTLSQPGISSAIIGASRPEQLNANLEATRVTLPVAFNDWIDAVGRDPQPAPALASPRLSDFYSELD